MSSEPSILHPEQIRRRKRGLIVFITVAVLVAIGSVLSSPVSEAIKTWRVRRLAAQAEALMWEQRLEEAGTKAAEAYRLKPEDEGAIRLAARVQNKTGQSVPAIPFWRRLKALKVMMPEDEVCYAEDLFRAGLQREALEQMTAVLSSQAGTPVIYRLAARIFLTSGQMKESIGYAEKAAELDPQNQEGKLLLALLKVSSGDAGLSTAGKKSLFELAVNRDKTGLDALGALATRSDLTPEEIKTLITGLKTRPEATEAHHLNALALELHLNPGQREELIASAMKERENADPAIKHAFGVWLNGRREHERTLAFLPKEVAEKRKDLLLVRLDALASLKRWEEIQQTLENRTVPLEEAYVQLFLARSFTEQGQASKANLHWSRAHAAAMSSPDQALYVAGYAEKTGQIAQAERAYRALASNATTARPAYESLLRIAESRKDTAALRSILSKMREQWPGDPAVLNDYAYMSLLLDLDINESFGIAEKLVAETPASLPPRTTLALAYYKKQAYASALKVYDNLNIPWKNVKQSHRVVYAAILAKNRMMREALEITADIEEEDLSPEEKALLPRAETP